ncbi:MAG: siderophore-interacting protein [Bacteroidota bacterium]
MPTLPKWLANGMEKVFSGMMHPVEVTHTAFPHKQLKRVRFEGDLSQAFFIPGQVIEFRINDNAFRHYTPAYYNQQAGICDVLFYLHGKGPGSSWASNLQVGDQTKLMGPGGRMKLDSTRSQHFLFGDESSLGFCLHMAVAIEAVNQDFTCLLELEPAHHGWPSDLGLESAVVVSSKKMADVHSGNVLCVLHEMDWTSTSCYLTGRAQSIQAVQKALLTKGVMRKQIQTFPYWADGKVGL